MRSNLTKKQVRSVTTLELAFRFNHLMHLGETAPAGIITYADMRETLWIEDELHRRLIVAIGHDFYPPEKPGTPTIAELKAQMKSNLMPTSTPESRTTFKPKPAPKPKATIVDYEMKEEGNLRFKIVITSSVGSVVARQNVKVDSKSDAAIMAVKMIEKLGLKKATYKIS